MTFTAFLITVLLLLGQCSADDGDTLQITWGIWISSDKTDTLHFASPNNFYKSNGLMQKDNFDYQLLPNDSIQIGYRGKQFVHVVPTTHKYALNNGVLKIDFTNRSCYGFDDRVMTYIKE
ncbi:hypothetical protein [Maribacter sp. 2307ULW6-5]|uniref:hypothetical protein n=1 Tax=Maribacter sp. 2307ULW6-5 TaxID=3386275 RepID=UPI0039BCD855